METGSGGTKRQDKDRQTMIWKKKKKEWSREILEFSSKSVSAYREMEEPLSIKATFLSETEKELKIPESQLSFALHNTYGTLWGSVSPPFNSVSHEILLYSAEVVSPRNTLFHCTC